MGFGGRLLAEQSGERMLGVEVLAAFLQFASLSGLLMAIFLDNRCGESGGAWVVKASGGGGGGKNGVKYYYQYYY